MELRHLRSFVAIADTMSFTQAAQALGIGQSALSQQIAKLEVELGVRLFDRTTRRVRLTEAGAEFLQPARQTLYQADVAAAAARSVGEAIEGRLRLGMAAGMTSLDIAELLAQFVAAHPQVEVTARSLRSEQTLLELQSGKLDIAYLYLWPGDTTSGIGLEPIVTEDLVALVPAGLGLPPRAELADLAAALPFADFIGGFGLRALSDDAFYAAGVERRIAFELTQSATLARFVSEGLAAAVVPDSIADLLCANPAVAGRIRKIELPAGTGSRTYALGWLGEQPASPAARAFLACFRAWDGGGLGA